MTLHLGRISPCGSCNFGPMVWRQLAWIYPTLFEASVAAANCMIFPILLFTSCFLKRRLGIWETSAKFDHMVPHHVDRQAYWMALEATRSRCPEVLKRRTRISGILCQRGAPANYLEGLLERFFLEADWISCSTFQLGQRLVVAFNMPGTPLFWCFGLTETCWSEFPGSSSPKDNGKVNVQYVLSDPIATDLLTKCSKIIQITKMIGLIKKVKTAWNLVDEEWA